MTVRVVIDDFHALDGQWSVEADITLDGDTCTIEIDEAIGAIDGRPLWMPGATFHRRIGRVESERLEQVLIARAREQMSAALKTAGGVP